MAKLGADLRTLSREAYIYLYPLVTMDVTHRQLTALPAGAKPGFGPPNTFHHMRQFPDADLRMVVRPNFDTLYSVAWLDLTSGPVRLSIADTADRYYMLPILDMWTDVIAVPGKRTTGTGPQEYVIVPPGYQGQLPEDATPIHATTPVAWIIGRTQTNGPDDYAAVSLVQDGYRLTELEPTDHQPDPTVDTTTEPLTQINQLSAVQFFTRAAQALRIHPPHATDFNLLARIADLGIIPGQDFDATRFSGEQLADIEAGAAEALHDLQGAPPTLGAKANGWISILSSIGVYGNNYRQRAVIAMVGLGANPAEDAVYPLLTVDANGEPLIGDRDYLIHFNADELPPVAAFWSVTMYDAEGFQAANPINRYALGDRDPLVYQSDGSLDITISHTEPEQQEANWLPAPTGPLGITMRLYAPEIGVLDGTWSPPPVQPK
jgi:hypothetical protein